MVVQPDFVILKTGFLTIQLISCWRSIDAYHRMEGEHHYKVCATTNVKTAKTCG